MLFDRIHLRIDDRAAVEGADRQLELKRRDQKIHADGRAAGDDGEADPGVMKPPRRRFRRIGQCLVLGQQRAIDVGNHQRDAGHVRFLLGWSGGWLSLS